MQIKKLKRLDTSEGTRKIYRGRAWGRGMRIHWFQWVRILIETVPTPFATLEKTFR